MGKAEEIVKELLIAEIKLRNELLIKHFGGVAFESVDKKVEQEQIGFEQPQSIVEFDLMEHVWKGKKLGEGRWADGSLAWGWDFVEMRDGTKNFKPETINALKKETVTIDQYVFTLDQERGTVRVRQPK